MDTLMTILAGLNAACAGINFVTQHFWIIPLNILAVILCIIDIYMRNK